MRWRRCNFVFDMINNFYLEMIWGGDPPFTRINYHRLPGIIPTAPDYWIFLRVIEEETLPFKLINYVDLTSEYSIFIGVVREEVPSCHSITYQISHTPTQRTQYPFPSP